LTSVNQKIVRAERLTREGFQPYGHVIEGEEEIPMDMEGVPTISIFTAGKRPFEIKEMARHCKTVQAFVAFGGRPWVLAVAPPDDVTDPSAVPDIKRIKAFLIPGDRGVMIHRGTWHYGPLPLDEKAYFVNVEAKGTNEEDFDSKSIDALGVKVIIEVNG